MILQTIPVVPPPHVLSLSSAASAKAKFLSLTCRKKSSSIFPLFPNYPLHLLSFAGLWLIDSVLSTTCFLPTVWRKFHLQISSAVSPFSPSQTHHPLALSTKNSTPRPPANSQDEEKGAEISPTLLHKPDGGEWICLKCTAITQGWDTIIILQVNSKYTVIEIITFS